MSSPPRHPMSWRAARSIAGALRKASASSCAKKQRADLRAPTAVAARRAEKDARSSRRGRAPTAAAYRSGSSVRGPCPVRGVNSRYSQALAVFHSRITVIHDQRFRPDAFVLSARLYPAFSLSSTDSSFAAFAPIWVEDPTRARARRLRPAIRSITREGCRRASSRGRGG